MHSIVDDSDPTFLRDLAAAVQRLELGRLTHLVLENDRNEASAAASATRAARREAYTAQWNDDLHHALHVLLTGETRGHYEDYERPGEQLLRALTEGFVYQGETSRYRRGTARGEPSAALPPEAFVSFLQNHDQIGNRPDGKRLWMLLPPERMLAAETLLALLPTPILMFMGDEFHAPSVFPFFCDFKGELAAAVTEGRRQRVRASSRTSTPISTCCRARTRRRRARPPCSIGARSAPSRTRARSSASARWLATRRDVLVPRLAGARAGGRAARRRARCSRAGRSRTARASRWSPISTTASCSRRRRVRGELLAATHPRRGERAAAVVRVVDAGALSERSRRSRARPTASS